MAIKGSIEIISAKGQSIGIDGNAFTETSVPVVVAAIHGITGLKSITPQERANQIPVAEWTATNPQGQDVTVALWEMTTFDATIIGKALAVAKRIEREDQDKRKATTR